MRHLVIGVIVALALAATPHPDASAADIQLPLPDVTVTAPGAANAPPYLREQWNSYGRNPYMGRFRVEEDKFARVPCSNTRIAATSGGACLQGYKLDISSNPLARGTCDMALDVTMYETAQISVEADLLIFDPYKVSGVGGVSPSCYVRGYLNYDVIDFADMNQVTRRGTNFRNLVGAGDDKSIEFDADGRHCKAIRHTGPHWQGGYVYIGHLSICRKDTAQVQAEDVAYVFNTLRVRTYDSEGNLRGADANSAPVAPLPSNPSTGR
ncbi:MAG TPA: hypothetical protein VM782_18780 [Stellaceae bacterium]|nr:hypothetical protein [Stellaceae bacterium]